MIRLKIPAPILQKCLKFGLQLDLYGSLANFKVEPPTKIQRMLPGIAVFATGTQPTRQIVSQLIIKKRLGNRRPIYLKSLESYLLRFAVIFPDLRVVTLSDLESFLGQHQNPYSRQTWKARLSILFNFAHRRGFISINPSDHLDEVKIDQRLPAILSAAQAAALVQACPTVCRPYLVLSLYAGIRPDELLRLTWSNVDLAAGLVRVDGKTRRQRIVPLEPIALALLRAHPLRSGPVSPSYFTIRRWKRGARAILGVSAWPKDILRHTAASFLLARYQDTAKVSFWLGNSPAILMRHYYAPVSAEDCSAFWNVEG